MEDFAAGLCTCVEKVHFMQMRPLMLWKHMAPSPKDTLHSSSSIYIRVPRRFWSLAAWYTTFTLSHKLSPSSSQKDMMSALP